MTTRMLQSQPPSTLSLRDLGLAIYRILLLDDDPDFVDATVEHLRGLGLEFVDVAHSLDEADRLLKLRGEYDAVLADEVLEPAGSYQRKKGRQGSDWLRERRRETEGARRVLVVADAAKLRNRQWIAEEGIRVAVKAADEETEVYEELAQAAEEKVDHALAAMARLRRGDEGTAGLRESDESLLAMKLQEVLVATFREWATTLPGSEEKDVILGGESYSVVGLVAEVMRGSPIGQTILTIFARQIRYRLGHSEPEVFAALPGKEL